jgi:hypothetical protein
LRALRERGRFQRGKLAQVELVVVAKHGGVERGARGAPRRCGDAAPRRRAVHSWMLPAPPAHVFSYPQSLASAPRVTAPPLSALTRGPRGAEVSACARRCVPGCVRGGPGAPGLGPLTLRKDAIVFGETGFRSRSYCVSECTRVCASASAAEVAKKP